MATNELYNKDGTINRRSFAALKPSAQLAEEERLQDELQAAKKSDDYDVRERAKRAYDAFRTFRREQRAANPQPAGEGDAVAQPETVKVKSNANSPKGA